MDQDKLQQLVDRVTRQALSERDKLKLRHNAPLTPLQRKAFALHRRAYPETAAIFSFTRVTQRMLHRWYTLHRYEFSSGGATYAVKQVWEMGSNNKPHTICVQRYAT